LIRLRSILALVLLALIGGLCLPTAGDTAFAAPAAKTAVTLQQAVGGQRLVILEEAPAPGRPPIADSEAMAVAASFVGTSGQATRNQPEYVRLTVRDEKGEVAWDIAARPVWLVTFPGVGYPSAVGSSDCSCLMNYWRPNTVVAVDASTGAPVIKLGVTS
jgi:hypothetical protein